MRPQPIQDRGGQGAVRVEDRGPRLAGAVRGHAQRPLFLAAAEHLAEQSGAWRVNRQRAECVKAKPGGLGVWFELRFETARTLRRGQGGEHLHGTGKEHRVAVEAGGIAERGRQVRFTLLMTMPF